MPNQKDSLPKVHSSVFKSKSDIIAKDIVNLKLYVFMSYSRKDEAVMQRITTFLREQGVNVWVDNEKLIPGTPIWEVEIEKAIRETAAAVVLLSPDSNASIWVRREISFAERYHKRIFPVLIAGDEDTSIMLRLSTSQYVDIRKDEEIGLNSLRAALSFYLKELEEQERKKQEVAKKAALEKAKKEKAEREVFLKAAREKIKRETAKNATQDKANRETAQEPLPKNAFVVEAPQPPAKKDDFFSQRGLVSLTISLLSLVSLGISLLSGAWLAYGILVEDIQSDFSTRIIVIGLVFAIGWIFGVLGIRVLGNLILPFFIRFYAILTLGGILYLQFRIIEKLFLQEYMPMNFIKYLALFSAGIFALVLLHLMLEKHSLVFFGVVILMASLAHLYLIAFHYVFVGDVNYNKLWGDIIFFLVTTTVSALMMTHLGLLNGIRSYIDHAFNPKDNQFVPPN